jgi:hypothetical protein
VDAEIRLAVQLAGQIEALGTAPLNGGHWRLFRTLDIIERPARSRISSTGSINTPVALMD